MTYETKMVKIKVAVNRAIILFTQQPRYLRFFLYYWTQCIDSFSLLLQRSVRKGNDAKNPAIVSFFFVTKRTQLNAAHAQLLEKLRPVAFYRNFPISNDPTVKFWRNLAKNSSETWWMIYRKNLNLKFLTTGNMQWKRFTVNYKNRLWQNFIRTVLTEWI